MFSGQRRFLKATRKVAQPLGEDVIEISDQGVVFFVPLLSDIWPEVRDVLVPTLPLSDEADDVVLHPLLGGIDQSTGPSLLVFAHPLADKDDLAALLFHYGKSFAQRLSLSTNLIGLTQHPSCNATVLTFLA